MIGRFDGGRITSDGGGLLLREVDRSIGLLDRLADCFADYRNPESIEHSVRELVAQRVYGLALGYEDLNDHDGLRKDSTLALLVGKQDLTGNSGCVSRTGGTRWPPRARSTVLSWARRSRLPRIVTNGSLPTVRHWIGCWSTWLSGVAVQAAARDLARPGCDR